jgi:hypothetical protein
LFASPAKLFAEGAILATMLETLKANFRLALSESVKQGLTSKLSDYKDDNFRSSKNE